MCVQQDFDSEWLATWSRALNEPIQLHRKVCEFCCIAQALYAADGLCDGRTGLGFGCGTEPLPSLFAKLGVHVLATAALFPDVIADPNVINVKVSLAGFTCTSFGLIIKKGG